MNKETILWGIVFVLFLVGLFVLLFRADGVIECYNTCNETYSWAHKFFPTGYIMGNKEIYKCSSSNAIVEYNQNCVDADGWEYRCIKHTCERRDKPWLLKRNGEQE